MSISQPQMRSESQIGDELAAKGATAPRVSRDDMLAKVAFTHMFNAGVASRAVAGLTQSEAPTALDHVTICLMVMHNGFVIVGKSAVASLENFDEAKGNHFAFEDALRQLWALEGYALRDRLQAGAGQ